MDFRIEKDLLGKKKVPQGAYWGIHTQRVLENFTISSYQVNPRLIRALAVVKKACVQTNGALNYLFQLFSIERIITNNKRRGVMAR